MEKLSLHRETVRRLTAGEAAAAAGGRRHYDLYTIGCHTGTPTCVSVQDCQWTLYPQLCTGN
jgi:hypothetical protein